MKTYHARNGFRVGVLDGSRVFVRSDDKPDYLLPVRTPAGMHGPHSPDGHAWGYSGSGPTQLAYDILRDLMGSEAARPVYVAFRDAFISGLDQDAGFEIHEDAIRQWLVDHSGRRDTPACAHAYLSPGDTCSVCGAVV